MLGRRQSLIFLIALLCLAGFLRLYRLDHYPLPMHQDELSNGYDAYSLAETGADKIGIRYPLVLRGGGAADYRPALYAWLAAIPTSLGGFSVTNSRLPSAILGVASLWLLFLFARTFGGEKFAFVSLIFGTLSPWHITFSRLALEGAILPGFFLILVFWLWQRAALRDYPTREIVLIGLSLGASASAYQSMRLVGPLMALLIFIDVLRHSQRPRRVAVILASAAILGAAPQFYVLLTTPDLFFARLVRTVISVHSASSFAREIAHNVGFVLNPKLLFWPDMRDTGMVSSRLLPVELAFYYLGLVVLASYRPVSVPRFRGYIYAAFAIGIIPGVMTGDSSSIRFGDILPLLPLWSAAGAIWLGNRLQLIGIPSLVRRLAFTIALVASVAMVGRLYLLSPKANGQRSNNALVKAGSRLKTLSPGYDHVYVVDSPRYAGLHIAAFSGMQPEEFQRTRIAELDANGFDHINAVGKYRFLKSRELADVLVRSSKSHARDLFVTPTPIPAARLIDSVWWFEDKYYFADTPLRINR